MLSQGFYTHDLVRKTKKAISANRIRVRINDYLRQCEYGGRKCRLLASVVLLSMIYDDYNMLGWKNMKCNILSGNRGIQGKKYIYFFRIKEYVTFIFSYRQNECHELYLFVVC